MPDESALNTAREDELAALPEVLEKGSLEDVEEWADDGGELQADSEGNDLPDE